MTCVQRDGIFLSPFHAWIRDCADLDSRQFQLSVTDNDFWIHRFSERNEATRKVRTLIEHVQIIESKSFFAQMPFAQRDTLQVVDLMLRKATVNNHRRRPIRVPDFRIGRTGCFRDVRWLGVHLVQMSADRPDNSDRIVWDGKYDVDCKTLIELLRFDRDPDHPQRALDTRRHHVPRPKERHPQLIFEAAE